MSVNVQTIGVLLLLASLVGILARRLRVPYTVGLVVAGLAMHFFFPTWTIPFDHDIVFSLLLPPLVFEAAYALDWNELRRSFGVVMAYATVGVALSCVVVFAAMSAFGWAPMQALVFGVVISATDPVSVIATFREAKVQGRLALLVEAESLFNDGTVAAAFSVIVTAALGSAVTPTGVATATALGIGGALLSGAAVAFVVLLLAGRTSDHLVEVTLTTVAAYGSFWLAESLHCSGVLATVVAGILVSNYRRLGQLTEKGREAVQWFWEYAGFVANSLIFLMIGMEVLRHRYEGLWIALAVAIASTLAGRALAVYGCSPFFRKRPSAVPARHQHVLFWGGLRGALALGLLQALPENFEGRETLLAVCFGVVTFSLAVQGVTMPVLLRRVGEIEPEPVGA